MLSNSIPDLSFPMMEFGSKQSEWDFSIFLYKGGSSLSFNKFKHALNKKELGEPLLKRLTLVVKLHDEVNADLVSGKSKATIKNYYFKLKNFFSWLDGNVENLKLENIESSYLKWCDYLINRQRFLKEISHATLYDNALVIGTLLDKVLSNNYSIFRKTGISKESNSAKFNQTKGSKLLLKDTLDFGQSLVSIANQLTTEKINEKLPLSISIDNKTITIWAGFKKPSNKNSYIRPSHLAEMELARINMGDEISYRRRIPLINIRIEAELLIFIAQTGMNLEQARNLKLDDFVYTSHLDGYQVKAYKARRFGNVLFEIFKEYRKHFELYLKWRKEWFKDKGNDLLFPFIFSEDKVISPPDFFRIRRLTKEYSLSFVSPRSLRKARVNWMLRTNLSPQQVADSAQHDIKTLFQSYDMPNPQVAMIEIAQFHKLKENSIPSVAPGVCASQIPISSKSIKDLTPKPDCINSAGCLFCENHRDIDSEDHIWSLASYRYLKSIELASFKNNNSKNIKNPIELVIKRVTEKLNYFENSSEERKKWVIEALNKVEEGDYHIMWDGLIQLQELNGVDE